MARTNPPAPYTPLAPLGLDELTARAEATPFNLDKLTLGELSKIEDLSGLGLEKIGDDDAPKGKLLAAMVFVAERRRGNALPWSECLDLEVEQAEAVLGQGATPADDDDDQGDDDGEDDDQGE